MGEFTGSMEFLHVKPHISGHWEVLVDYAGESRSFVHESKEEALKDARRKARTMMPCCVHVYDLGGSLQATYNYRSNALKRVPKSSNLI